MEPFGSKYAKKFYSLLVVIRIKFFGHFFDYHYQSFAGFFFISVKMETYERKQSKTFLGI